MSTDAAQLSSASAKSRQWRSTRQGSDLSVSLEHYHRLGFATRAYEKGGYGFTTRDDVEILGDTDEAVCVDGKAADDDVLDTAFVQGSQ